MTESLASLSERALEDLRDVFARLPDDAADPLIEAIAAARHVVVYGCARASRCACASCGTSSATAAPPSSRSRTTSAVRVRNS